MAPAALRARFAELGEERALAQIVEEGRRRMRADPDVPWPEERQAVHDAIAARDELREHEQDVETARADAEACTAREAELQRELEQARKELEDCLAGRRADGTGPSDPAADALPRRPRWADQDAPALDDA
jgi:hypothetical protein